MPIATPQQFARMLAAAHSGGYAYPAVNCTTLSAMNAVFKGLADAGSDGIVQINPAAGRFASGVSHRNAFLGAVVLAEAAHRLAAQYPVLVALNTDHCGPEAAPGFLLPLIEETARRRARGENNLFQNHMLDASHLPLRENLRISREYLQRCAEQDIVLEVEAGVVGGEEEGAAGSKDTPEEKLYTTPEDMLEVYETLHGVGRFTLAATFGNVHGIYKPGTVKLRPEILRQGQDAVMARHGTGAKMALVFHGGSGTPLEQIHETLRYGVVKMNLDTDTQYAFTRPIADHMLKHYDGVLKVDGEIADKQYYEARSYLVKAEEAMAVRVAQACHDLRSAGRSLGGQARDI